MGIENNLHIFSPEQSKKKRLIITEVDIEDQARDIAAEKLTASKAELSGFSGFFKKIWKHNLAHEYYRQKEIARAKREIQESRNIYAGEGGDKSDHDHAMKAIMERFEMSYDVENALRKDEERKILHDRVPEEKTVKNIIIDLIKKYAVGDISEEQFNSEKDKLFNKELAGIKENGNLVRRGSLYADNLLETAKQIKENISHGKGLEALDSDFEVVIGKAKAGVATKPQYNAVDRITEKIQKSFVGSFVNEATVAAAVAVVYGTAVKGSVNAAQRAAKWVGPVGLGLSAGIGGAVAGIRENKRVKEERAQHIREMAKGKKIEAGSPRREEMEKFRYETRSANELIQNIREALKKLKDKQTKENLESLLSCINEIDSRIAFSEREAIDLISFSDAKKVEQERTEMYIAAAEAKAYLKKNISSDWSTLYKDEQEFKGYLAKAKESKIDTFKKEKTLKDEAFAKMKKEKVAGAIMKGVGIGIGVGLVAQEIQAALSNSSEGLLDAKEMRTPDKVRHFTSLEYLRRYISGEMPRMDMMNMKEIALGSSICKLPAGLDLVENEDGTYNIIRSGSEEALFEGIKIGPDGTLSEESKELMEEKGIFTESFKSQIEEYKQVKAKEYVSDHKDLFSKIKRVSWADNDSLAPDKNELKLLWGGKNGVGIDRDGNYIFNVKNMIPEGSFHKGAQWDARELVRDGKMKLLISLSKDTQGQVIEIPIDADGNAIIDPDSEIGKIAFQNINGRAKFLGKFAEVAVMDSKGAHVLATHTGEGIKNIESTEMKDVQTLIFDAPADYDVGLPYVIPIAGRRPLEKLGGNKEEINNNNMKEKMPFEYIPATTSVEKQEESGTMERKKIELLKGFLESILAKAKPMQGQKNAGPAVARENNSPARMAALHTLHKLEQSPNLTYADLMASNMEEGDKKFLELTRNLWTELTIHGFKKFDSKTGAWTIEKRADLDAYSCLKLMELAGIKVEMDKVNFVAPGEKADSGIIMDTSKEQHGVIAEENGKRVIFDHHGKESDRSTSATKFVYETLLEMGLLEKKEHLDKYVEFVTRCDNFNYPENEMQKIYENYPKNLYGLSGRIKTEDILELFEKGIDPAEELPKDYLKKHTYFNPSSSKEEPLDKFVEFFEEQIKKGERAIKKLEKEGSFFDTGDDRFGRVLIDTRKRNGKGNWYSKIDGENKSGQLTAFMKGFGAYIIWSPRENSFVINTKNKMDEQSIPGGFGQGFNVRGNMWLKPNQNGEKLTLTLEDVLSKLSGKNIQIDGKLKEALAKEAKVNEIWSAIDDNKLTEDVLRQSATDLNIPLNKLLGELVEQAGQLKVVNNKLKGKPKNNPAVLEGIRLEVLLEYQKNRNGNGQVVQAPAQPAAPSPASQPPTIAAPVQVSQGPQIPLQAPAMPKGVEDIKTPDEIIKERSGKIYEMIMKAEGFDRLHFETQKKLVDGFYEALARFHWIAPDLEKKIKGIKLDIKADNDQLKDYENIILDDAEMDKDKIIIPIVWDKMKSKGKNNDFLYAFDDNDSIVGFLEEKNIIENSVNYSKIAKGRVAELSKRYPEFYKKISSAANWSELNEQTKNILADAFLAYLDLYPEQVPKIDIDQIVIEMDSGTKAEMKKGEPAWISEIFRDSDNKITLRLDNNMNLKNKKAAKGQSYWQKTDLKIRKRNIESLKSLL